MKGMLLFFLFTITIVFNSKENILVSLLWPFPKHVFNINLMLYFIRKIGVVHINNNKLKNYQILQTTNY